MIVNFSFYLGKSDQIFVDTSSKRGMVKDEETAGVTEYIIPIPWNVLRPSKVLELWSALSATWCMKCVGSAELDSDTPGILVPWCTAAQCSYLRTSLYETQNPCLFNESIKNLDQNADAFEYQDQV